MTSAIQKYILSRVIPTFANTYMHENEITQQIPSGTNYTILDLFNPEFISKHFELDIINKRLVAKKAGNYLATLSFSSLSTSNIVLETVSFKNGQSLDNIHIYRELKGVGAYSSASVSGIITVNKGDYIDVRVKHDSLSEINLTVRFASMLLIKI